MKIPKNVNVVNDAYRSLSERAIMLRNTLEKLGYDVEWGYYDRHTVTVNGDSFLEYYPIPVLTVNGICDILIDFIQTSIDGKLFSGEFEEKFDFAKLAPHKFECYGVENYLESLYAPGMSRDELIESVRACGEAEIGVAAGFEGEPLMKEILDLLHVFVSMGTHTEVHNPVYEGDEESKNALDGIDESTPAFQVADALLNE